MSSLNVTPYVGIPYKVGEADCWTLCRDFAASELNIYFPEYMYDTGKYMQESETIIAQERSMLGMRWIEVVEPEIGDILIMRIKGRALHCAIYIGDDLFLHTLEGRNSTVEDINGHWAQSICGFFRWIG
jgi:cell wall-associated NlpC family hydrolase